MVTHQSHLDREKGQTDSSHKLERLKMPSDLTGKTALDIGCNEGFFCDQAVRRNAARVIGIDMDDRFLAVAKDLYKDERIEFRKQGWSKLPDGPFDLVLWTSAMHYELDPPSVLRRIADALSPEGLFILECGVSFNPGKEMIYSLRHDGGLWYPTLQYLEESLADCGLSYRQVSGAERVGTDPIPRVVYHCRKRQPTVMIVTGETQEGKSNIASLLGRDSTKIISLDHFVSRIYSAAHHHTDLEKHIKENLNPNSLGPLYESFDSKGLTKAYARLLAQCVASTDRLVIIEGKMTDAQILALSEQLKGKARVWSAKRSN